jgi:hypothetical protein
VSNVKCPRVVLRWSDKDFYKLMRIIMHIKVNILLLTIVLSVGMLIPVNGYTFNLFSRFTSVEGVNGEVHIEISAVNDGKAHYYSFKDGEKEIKMFVIKSPDGLIRAAFDACDVCFPEKKGYTQEGDFMVCNNCGRKFHSDRVNTVEGGCNPAPLKRQEVDGKLVILVEDIIPGARFF